MGDDWFHSHPQFAAYVYRQVATIEGVVIGQGDRLGMWLDSWPRNVAVLPRALASAVAAGFAPSLSLVRDLLALTSGRVKQMEQVEQTEQSPLAQFAQHKRVIELAGLGWSIEACIAPVLVLLRLLRDAGYEPNQDFVLPDDGWPGRVELCLVEAIGSYARDEPGVRERVAGHGRGLAAMTAPIGPLGLALDRVDEPLLTLLAGLGETACAAEPSLPLSLLDRLDDIVALSAPERAILGRNMPAEMAGRAEGSSLGVTRQGVAHRGDVKALVPSEWALRDEVRAYRYSRGELLYRAQMGREPPRLRPTVLVLDVSATCLGAIAEVLRPAAHYLARALLQAGEPAFLLAAGGDNTTRALQHPSDVLEILAARTLEPVDLVRTFDQARGLREALAGDSGMEPVIVLMSHIYFGAEHRTLNAPSHLRALFAEYPRHSERPAWTDRCERWQALPVGNPEAIPDAVARIME